MQPRSLGTVPWSYSTCYLSRFASWRRNSATLSVADQTNWFQKWWSPEMDVAQSGRCLLSDQQTCERRKLKDADINICRVLKQAPRFHLHPILGRQTSVGTQLHSLTDHKMYMIFPSTSWLSGNVQSSFSQTKTSHPHLAAWKRWTHLCRVFPPNQYTADPGGTWALSRCVKILGIWHDIIVFLHPKQCFIKTLVLHIFFQQSLDVSCAAAGQHAY